MKKEKEYKGQFPSKNCECHIQKPYGFVPELDCKEHDTKQFFDFIDLIRQEEREKLLERIEKVVIKAVKETEKEHKSPNVYIDMVGEIIVDNLEALKYETCSHCHKRIKENELHVLSGISETGQIKEDCEIVINPCKPC